MTMDSVSVGVGPEVKTYNCARGHEWRMTRNGLSFSFYRPWCEGGSKVAPLATTGPICPICVCEDLKAAYGAREVPQPARPMRVYVASSWRNPFQQGVVAAIRGLGLEVYDFRHPGDGDFGFGWEQVASPSDLLSPSRFRHVLGLSVPKAAFRKDMTALENADVTVLVLPCGRSAHLELGWAAGHGQKTIVLLDDPISEPELMYLACSELCVDLGEVVSVLRRWRDDGLVSRVSVFKDVEKVK